MVHVLGPPSAMTILEANITLSLPIVPSCVTLGGNGEYGGRVRRPQWNQAH